MNASPQYMKPLLRSQEILRPLLDPWARHANTVREAALQFLERRGGRSPRRPSLGAQCAPLLANMGRVKYRGTAQAGTFFARDNVSNFIAWCRQGLDIMECLLFETDDLCLRKNEKHVILCLLEVARRGARLGMPAPVLVQMEREIDRELAAEQRAMAPNNAGSDFSDEEDVAPISIPQIVTNDLKSLDEMAGISWPVKVQEYLATENSNGGLKNWGVFQKPKLKKSRSSEDLRR
uniref:Uncharacterized protein n=1 Tax=Timema tahoe TaxID=61484 RepID=A0A7R9IQA6_9NEOP|nr:unnamed protein product [Timema tahoe]